MWQSTILRGLLRRSQGRGSQDLGSCPLVGWQGPALSSPRWGMPTLHPKDSVSPTHSCHWSLARD